LDYLTKEPNADVICKQHAMNLFGEALEVGNRCFNFTVSDDAKIVIMEDTRNGATRKININGDNIPAMIRDVMEQAIDWIL
jgi:hypothetical protein